MSELKGFARALPSRISDRDLIKAIPTELVGGLGGIYDMIEVAGQRERVREY